jgi:hypothetical protein
MSQMMIHINGRTLSPFPDGFRLGFLKAPRGPIHGQVLVRVGGKLVAASASVPLPAFKSVTAGHIVLYSETDRE